MRKRKAPAESNMTPWSELFLQSERVPGWMKSIVTFFSKKTDEAVTLQIVDIAKAIEEETENTALIVQKLEAAFQELNLVFQNTPPTIPEGSRLKISIHPIQGTDQAYNLTLWVNNIGHSMYHRIYREKISAEEIVTGLRKHLRLEGDDKNQQPPFFFSITGVKNTQNEHHRHPHPSALHHLPKRSGNGA